MNYGLGNELGKLGSSRRVFNDNRCGIFGLVCSSFGNPSVWLEESLITSKRSNLRTRRFLAKVVAKGQLIMNIASPEVIRVEETQMSEVTQSRTGRH